MKHNLLFYLLISSTFFNAQVKEKEEIIVVVETPAETQISELPDKEAEFPGGADEMMKYLSENIKYPPSAIEMNEQGRVFLSFIVEVDGTISSVKVEKGVSDVIDQEAIRIVQSMPKWTPGTLAEKAVRSKAILPINFTLYGDDEEEEESERKIMDAHWAGFDFGTLILMSDLFETDFTAADYWKNDVARSMVFNFNFFDYKLPIFKQYLG